MPVARSSPIWRCPLGEGERYFGRETGLSETGRRRRHSGVVGGQRSAHGALFNIPAYVPITLTPMAYPYESSVVPHNNGM